MLEQEFLKELNRPVRVVIEHHVVIEIDIRRCVSPDFNSRIVRMGTHFEVRSLLNCGNLDRDTGNREECTPNKIRQIWLEIQRNGAPFVQYNQQAHWIQHSRKFSERL